MNRAAFDCEFAKEFGAIRTELADFRTEVAKQFGLVDVRLESVKTSIEQTKRWVLVSGLGVLVTALTAVATLVTLGHALKLF